MKTPDLRFIIKKAIDEWDPIQLIAISPPDEYSNEIDMIYSVITVNKEISAGELSNEIYSIFINQFGDDFHSKIDECYNIAKKIVVADSTCNQ